MLEFLRKYFKRKNKTDVFKAFDHVKIYDESYLASWDEKNGEKLKNLLWHCRNGDLSEKEAMTYLSIIENQVKKKIQ